jgi:general secretion pathway protein G
MVKTLMRARRGFTLIEMLVVLAIVALLLTLAAPRYFGSIETSKEAVLRDNLRTVRTTLEQFYADNARYPKDLDELVERKYLRALPVDPFVESTSAWQIVPPAANVPGGVYDIKSSASGSTRDGLPLSEL